MPARQRYDAPHEQLRALGVQAMLEGLGFEEFWQRALRIDESPNVTTESVRNSPPPPGAVVWPRDSAEKKIAKAALMGTKEGWRHAYEGLPPSNGEIALARLYGVAIEAAGGIPLRDAVPLAA